MEWIVLRFIFEPILLRIFTRLLIFFVHLVFSTVIANNTVASYWKKSSCLDIWSQRRKFKNDKKNPDHSGYFENHQGNTNSIYWYHHIGRNFHQNHYFANSSMQKWNLSKQARINLNLNHSGFEGSISRIRKMLIISEFHQ